MFRPAEFRNAVIWIAAVLGASLPHSAIAEYGDVVAAFPFGAAKFARDAARQRMYATVPERDALAVVDAQTLDLIALVPAGREPQGVALSRDGERLYIAATASSAIVVLNADTLDNLHPIMLPAAPFDLRAGVHGRLYVTPAGQTTDIMMVDVPRRRYLGEFSGGVFIYAAGMLEIDPTGTRLYFANQGLSPGSLAQFDVSAREPVLLWTNDHGDLGSNGQDLALTADGMFVSYAVGGGNLGYEIFKMSTSDFSVAGSFQTGPYPREITYSPDGTAAYTVHTSGRIDVFNALTYHLRLPPLRANGEATELLTDHTGRYLFAAFPDGIRVYDVGTADIGQPQQHGS